MRERVSECVPGTVVSDNLLLFGYKLTFGEKVIIGTHTAHTHIHTGELQVNR